MKADFNLSKYIEAMAWRSFMRNRDSSMNVDDYIQEAYLAVARASASYKKNRGTAFNTHAINCTKYHFLNLLKGQKGVETELLESASFSIYPDDLGARIKDALGSRRISGAAKSILLILVFRSGDMERCSKAELRRISGLSVKRFQAACLELAAF